MEAESYRAQAFEGSGNDAKGEASREAANCLESEPKLCVSSWEVRGCCCKSQYCEQCGPGRGLDVRKKLIEALSTFQGIFMVTLTHDQVIFNGDPRRAFEYVKGKAGSGNSQHLIGELVRTLWKRGYLHSRRYFCVLECQKNGFPHWHLLLDASFIPVEVIRARWDSFRPKDAGPVQGNRPAFGAVRFSAPKFADHKHAAHYACKYLIKNPEQGFPDWLLGSSRVHRFTTSKGLFPADRVSDSSEADDESPIDFQESLAQVASECDGVEFSKFEGETDEAAVEFLIAPSTIRERIAKCKSRCVLLEVITFDRDGEKETKRRFISKLAISLDEAKSLLGRSESGNAFEVSSKEAQRMLREFGPEPIVKGRLRQWFEATTPATSYDSSFEVEPVPSDEDEPFDADEIAWARIESTRRLWESVQRSEAEQESPDRGGRDPRGAGPGGGGGEASAVGPATLSCPLASNDGCDDANFESVGEALVHLRDVHGVTGDQAYAVVDEAIDDLGDDISRHRWERVVADALAGLLGEDDADSREKGEAA